MWFIRKETYLKFLTANFHPSSFLANVDCQQWIQRLRASILHSHEVHFDEAGMSLQVFWLSGKLNYLWIFGRVSLSVIFRMAHSLNPRPHQKTSMVKPSRLNIRYVSIKSVLYKKKFLFWFFIQNMFGFFRKKNWFNWFLSSIGLLSEGSVLKYILVFWCSGVESTKWRVRTCNE
jgi:hypothetical protein